VVNNGQKAEGFEDVVAGIVQVNAAGGGMKAAMPRQTNPTFSRAPIRPFVCHWIGATNDEGKQELTT